MGEKAEGRDRSQNINGIFKIFITNLLYFIKLKIIKNKK